MRRHQQHFTVTLESLHSIETLTQQYEQGLRDADTVASCESLLQQGDESCLEQLSNLGLQYGAAQVSMEDQDNRLQALIAWAKQMFQRIWAYIQEIYAKLKTALSMNLDRLRARNAKLKEKIKNMTSGDKVEVDGEAFNDYRAASERKYINVAARFSQETRDLVKAVQSGLSPNLLYPRLERHWEVFCQLYPNTIDLAAALSNIETSDKMLRTYKHLLNQAGAEKVNVSHPGARPGRALVTQMELQELSKHIDDGIAQIESFVKAAAYNSEEIHRDCRRILDDIQRRTTAAGADVEEYTRSVVEVQGVAQASAGATAKVAKKESSVLGDILSVAFSATDAVGAVGGGLG